MSTIMGCMFGALSNIFALQSQAPWFEYRDLNFFSRKFTQLPGHLLVLRYTLETRYYDHHRVKIKSSYSHGGRIAGVGSYLIAGVLMMTCTSSVSKFDLQTTV